jgi:hypothetical protein
MNNKLCAVCVCMVICGFSIVCMEEKKYFTSASMDIPRSTNNKNNTQHRRELKYPKEKKVDKKNNEKESPVRLTTRTLNNVVARELTGHKSDNVHIQDAINDHIIYGKYKSVQLVNDLIETYPNFDVNVRGKQLNFTLMHVIASIPMGSTDKDKKNYISLILEMKKKGADLSLCDSLWRTPQDVAQDLGKPDDIAILFKNS